MFSQSYALILGCNVLSRSAIVCIYRQCVSYSELFSAAMSSAEAQLFALDESIQCSNAIVSYIQLNIIISPLCQYVTCSHSYAVLGFTALSRITTGRSRLAFTHLQRFVQAFLATTFQQFLTTLGFLWKSGPTWNPVTLFQPHESGDRTSGSPMSDCPQMCSAW